jgi:hypothetical protein
MSKEEKKQEGKSAADLKKEKLNDLLGKEELVSENTIN